MSFSYVFHLQAQQDYEESLNWYLEKSQRAAAGFVDAVNGSITQICAYPTRLKNTYKHYHEIGLKKYPFVIIYSINQDDEMVIVWKIFHYKRNPKRKFRGLKKI